MKNTDKLHQFFFKNFPFNELGLKELINSFEEEQYKKDEIILKQGSIELKLKFIESGFVREFYTSNSKEVNVNFYEANQFATDLNSFFEGVATSKNLQCLSEVKVLSIRKNELDKLLLKYKCGHEIIQSSFQKTLAAKEKMEKDKLTKTTEELYKGLQSKKPNWLKYIPQYHIASYLNITPETLSRIRKRIY